MKKSIVIINAIIFFGLFSCSSTKNIKQSDVKPLLVNKIQKAINFISNDTVFIDRLKKYYPDLGKCKNLNIESNSTISPVSIGHFRKNQLIKTSFFKKYNTLSDLEFNKEQFQYDTANNFKEYNVELSDENISKSCKIKLTFSEENNNLLPIKYSIVDENIDPKIDYHPRVGYYLVEFDSRENILQRFYILRSN